MAVFPDRIVLKNSTDADATIIAEIETGGASAITQGEVVLGLAAGAATLYTKDSVGDIVTISGSGGAGPTPYVQDWVIDSSSDSATSQVLNAPVHSAGDLLVAVIMSRDTGGTLTPPSGYTLYGTYLSDIELNADVQSLSVFTKTASASEPISYTWTQSSAGRICGWIASVGGNAVIDDVVENYGNGATATITTVSDRLNLTAATWIYAATSPTVENYSQSGDGLTEITDSPVVGARISGGYTTLAGTATSTHDAATADDDPNHGMIRITLSGVKSINDNSDVDTTTTPPADGQALVWDNANAEWIPGNVATDLGSTSIDALQDVDTTTTAPTNDQVLAWNGTNWVPADQSGGSGGGSVGGDPLFSNVTVLATFDGETDGASTWTTYGSTSPTWTANGATISNTQTRWGGTTSLSVGAGAPSIPCSLGTDDWTIEAWVRLDQGTWNNFGSIFQNGLLANTYDTFYVGPNGSATSSRFRISNSGSSLLTITGNCEWHDDEWNHVAICRAGDIYSAYVNGEKVGSGTVSSRTFNSGDLQVSGSGSSTAYVQDFRITSGVARYSTAFYPTPDPADQNGAAVRAALGIGEYVDDAAAGTGGVASGAMYYNTTSSDYRLKT